VSSAKFEGDGRGRLYHSRRAISLTLSTEGKKTNRMMTWLAWLVIALALLVIVLNLWMIWQRVSDATPRPAEPETLGEGSSEANPEGEPALPDVLGVLDERGYLSSRKLPMGCEAAICRTPSGARIVAGKRDLKEPQYAWDYVSVRLAEKALVCAEFNTHPREGIIGVEDFGRGSYPAAEPQDYFRRWRYTSEGQLERI
jgi:hypothetical protein